MLFLDEWQYLFSPPAFIAALYIDKDLEYVHTFMNVCFFPRLKVRSVSFLLSCRCVLTPCGIWNSYYNLSIIKTSLWTSYRSLF